VASRCCCARLAPLRRPGLPEVGIGVTPIRSVYVRHRRPLTVRIPPPLPGENRADHGPRRWVRLPLAFRFFFELIRHLLPLRFHGLMPFSRGREGSDHANGERLDLSRAGIWTRRRGRAPARGQVEAFQRLETDSLRASIITPRPMPVPPEGSPPSRPPATTGRARESPSPRPVPIPPGARRTLRAAERPPAHWRARLSRHSLSSQAL